VIEDKKSERRIDVVAGDRRRLVMGGMVVLLGGCAGTKIPPPSEWPVVEMEDAEVMPGKALLEDINRRTKVVVMQPAESPANRGAGLANIAEAALIAVCGAGSVEVVDRKVADRLDKELKLIEIQGSTSAAYSGPQVADFAITVALGTASASSKFNAASSYVDKKTGKTITTPASYTNGAESKLTVRVYELPSLRLVASIPAEGSSTVFGQNVPASQAQLVPLMQAATEDAIVSKKADVLNLFSRKGYVSERRAKDKKNIFRALISRQMGAKPGDEVEIVSLKSSVDPLTKRSTTDEAVVVSGRISDVIGEESSWIIVDDEGGAAKVRRGDIVKVKHKKNIWDSLPIPTVIKNAL
jgi:hypothetical protein